MSEVSDGLESAWILMCLEDFENKTPKKKKNPNLAPLLDLLRSDKPISGDVRKLLADLFDPKKPIGVYATIEFSKHGRPSVGLRDHQLYELCEALKFESGWKRISEPEWEKILLKINISYEDYPIGNVASAKQAYFRGKRIDDELCRIRAEQE